MDRRVWPNSWKRLKEDPRFEREETDFPGINNWPRNEEEAYEEYLVVHQEDEDGNRGCPFWWLWDE